VYYKRKTQQILVGTAATIFVRNFVLPKFTYFYNLNQLKLVISEMHDVCKKFRVKKL